MQILSTLNQAILAAAPSLICELVPLFLDTLPLVSAVLKAWAWVWGLEGLGFRAPNPER